MNKRRGSIVTEFSNPLENGSGNRNVTSIKIENLSDCRIITGEEADSIIKELKNKSQNEERLELLESLKTPFLFTSDILLKIVDITPSVKTKLSIIAMLGPRLTDPKAKMQEIVDLFRYNEDKEKVEDILKSRLQNLNSAIFNKVGSPPKGSSNPGRGGRGSPIVLVGRGGRGTNALNGRGQTSTNDKQIKPQKEIKTELSDPVDINFSNKVSMDSSMSISKDINRALPIANNSTQKRNDSIDQTILTTTYQLEFKSNVNSKITKSNSLRATDIPTNSDLKTSTEDKEFTSSESVISENFNEIKQLQKTLHSVTAENSHIANNSKTIDKENSFFNQLGISKEILLSLKEKWESKYETYLKDIDNEIKVVLTCLSLSQQNAVLVCNEEMWEKKYQKEVQYKEKEKLLVYDELRNIWNLLGLTTVEANVYSQLLENWEIKVVNTKIDDNEKKTEEKSMENRRRKSTSVEISNEIFYPNLIHIANHRRFSNMINHKNGMNTLMSSEFNNSTNRQTINSFNDSSNGTSNVNSINKRKKSLSLDLTKYSMTENFNIGKDIPSGSTIRQSKQLSSNTSTNSLDNYTKSHYNNVKYLIDRNGNNLSNDFVDRSIKTSFALNMDPRDLSDLDYTGPIGFDPIERYPIYTYQEILRRNARKQYYELSERELEKYLSNEEFFVKFGMTKEIFYKLAKWKQIELKKSLLLF